MEVFLAVAVAAAVASALCLVALVVAVDLVVAEASLAVEVGALVPVVEASSGVVEALGKAARVSRKCTEDPTDRQTRTPTAPPEPTCIANLGKVPASQTSRTGSARWSGRTRAPFWQARNDRSLEKDPLGFRRCC